MMKPTLSRKMSLNIIYAMLYNQSAEMENFGEYSNFYFNMETWTVQEGEDILGPDLIMYFLDINVTVNSETFAIKVERVNTNYTETFGFLKLELPRLPLFAILIKMSLVNEALTNYIYKHITNDARSFRPIKDEQFMRLNAQHEVIMRCIDEYCIMFGVDKATTINLLNNIYIDIAQDMLFVFTERMEFLDSGNNPLRLMNMPIRWFSYDR